jgi:N-carbamoylputrescine amidase
MTPMPDDPELITAYPPPDSPARTRPPTRAPLRVGAVQARWHPDPEEHAAALATGIELATGEGARLVCLQELTLSPYFAITPDGPGAAGVEPEDLTSGPTVSFARRMAKQTGAYIHASLYERPEGDGLGYNTAVVLAPDGNVVDRTRKLHIPITAGYYEDRYFRPGPADGDPFPVTALKVGTDEARVGFPT